jgi:hypothetical protein
LCIGAKENAGFHRVLNRSAPGGLGSEPAAAFSTQTIVPCTADKRDHAISEKRVLDALGPVDAAKVTTTIVRDANGWPSASFACPDDLKEKLRQYIERIQSD